jgi:DNA transposition AAA+ family ATPase
MASNQLVETSVSRLLFETCDKARERNWNAAIIGPTGVGKTRSLTAYAEAHPDTHLFCMTAVTGNALRDLLLALAEMLGVYVPEHRPIGEVQRRMFQYDLSDRLLIFDEAQNLKHYAFREVLNLHDFAGLPIVFCGNDQLLKRVNVETGAFAQISDRIALREHVDGLTEADCDALAEPFGLDGLDAQRLVRSLGTRFRARAIMRVLTDARQHAGERKPIKAQHIREAVELFPQYRAALSLKPVRSGVA